MKTPLGALSTKERTNKLLSGDRGKKGWHMVNGGTGILYSANEESPGFRFSVDPIDGTYYFNNYWFALAYSLRLKAKNEIKVSK